MDVTKTCRSINELQHAAQMAVKLLFQECARVGIDYIFITETYRSQERQDYLYAQGRTRPGKQVTWTRSSNHKNRLAWDIAVGGGKNLYDKDTLNRVGAIAGKLGIEWGGTWGGKNYDAPHFQVKSNWTIPKGYVLLEVEVPTASNRRTKVTGLAKEEEDETLKFTSNATKTAVRDFLVQSVAKKKFSQDWITKFDKGEMTNGDLEGLRIIANY